MNSAFIIIVLVLLVVAIASQMLSLKEAFANPPAQPCGGQGQGPCPQGTKCMAGFCAETEERNVPAKETIIGHKEVDAGEQDDLDNPYSVY